MKKLILTLSLLLSANLYAQQSKLPKLEKPSGITIPTGSDSSIRSIDGFWGIKFGSTKTIAKSIMQEKGLTIASEKSDYIVYTGGRWSGEKIKELYLEFIEGKFYKGIVVIDITNEGFVFSTYNSIKKKIDDKYFNTYRSIEKYDYPFEKGDGHEITAIRSGKANIVSNWKMDNDTSITVLIPDDLNTTIYYTDLSLERIANNKKLEKESKDL